MAASLTKNEPNGKGVNKNENSIINNFSTSNESLNFTLFDLAVLIMSIFSIISDICTDLILVIQYTNQGYKAWAISTFVLTFFPSLIVQFFSLRWYIIDKTTGVLHWVLHFCILGIIFRYVNIIKAAFAAYKSKNPSDIQKIYLDQSDLCMLHLFESFLESAPQLVLQLYVIAMLHEWRVWTGMSALASLLSLAWALAAYTKAQRRARSNKNSSSWPGLLLQAIWRMGMLTSRISTLVLCAYCFGNYIFIIIAIHWIVMTIWIIYQKTDFCETYWEELIYNAVVGVIYCFCFFNLQEGQSRWRAFAFYLVIVFQNLSCLTIFLMWFADKTPKLAISSFIAVIGGMVLGAASMLVYYRFFHPSGPIVFFGSENVHALDASSCYSSMTLRSLKRSRVETQSGTSPKNTSQSDSKQLLKGQTPLSESIVIIEENVLDNTDTDIKILQDWINDENQNKGNVKKLSNEVEKDGDAFKRRAICSSVDLVNLMKSKTPTECESLKLVGTDEASSEILSAHDYENLAAVNIARETWGLRSWRGYSDIETWLHDDSVVNDRRLDTLTSTSSDRSANTLQKNEERVRQDDYIDSIAEDLVHCESEASSDDILGQYSIESFSVVYPLGTLDPIFEETEESSTSTEFIDLKMRNGSASTLVATIDEIRRNTPTQNRFRLQGIYNGFSPSEIIIKSPQRNRKKVTFAGVLRTFSKDGERSPSEDTDEVVSSSGNETKEKQEGKKEVDGLPEEEIKVKDSELNPIIIKDVVEPLQKENIPTVASKINQWNKILMLEGEKKVSEKERLTAFKREINFCQHLRFSNFQTFQKKNCS